MSDRYLTRREMVEALERLGEVLSGRGVTAHLYLVGGSAIAFAYLSDRVTRDIDAIAAPTDEVFDAAREITSELELPEEWLNDTARAFLPVVDLGEGAVVLDVPGITVRTAPAEVLLAMKLLAGRAKDVDDLRLLAATLDLRDAGAVWEVFLRYYPQGHLVEHARLLVEELFGEDPAGLPPSS